MHYIGSFNITSNSILIGDPMSTMITALQYNLDSPNLCRMRFDSPAEGEWNAYHICNRLTIDALLLVNEIKSKHLNASSPDCTVPTLIGSLKRYGKICTAFGRAIFVVDGIFFNTPEYAYSPFYESALFNIDELLSIPNLESNILKRIASYKKENPKKEYISGEMISEFVYGSKIDITSINSNVWSVDAVERAYSSVCHASVIKGGMVNCTNSSFCSCYADNDNPSCILICLNEDIEENTVSDCCHSNIIEFPY